MAAHTYISLFSGAGMLDVAVSLALPGARCVGYCEREGPAAAILASRMGQGDLDEAPIYSDVRSFPSRLYRGRVAGVIGGSPCQDISVAGRQEGIHGNRSSLFFDYVRIIREVGARWAFLENVPGLLAFPTGNIVLREFASIGMHVEWGTLRASDVGAPHHRDRVFMLAWRAAGNGLRECEFCGYEFDANCGRYGYPNCEGEGLAIPRRKRLQRRKLGKPHGPLDRGDALGPASELCGALFPPRPGDTDAWREILAVRPDLAPATESGVRGVAHGAASRVDRLRACGNGVVALQGAAAFVALAHRAGLFEGELFDGGAE